MKDSSVFIAIGASMLGALFVGVLSGGKLGENSAYDQCINYYSKSSVEEARATCKQIIWGKK
jgi:hypothetical protein